MCSDRISELYNPGLFVKLYIRSSNYRDPHPRLIIHIASNWINVLKKKTHLPAGTLAANTHLALAWPKETVGSHLAKSNKLMSTLEGKKEGQKIYIPKTN